MTSNELMPPMNWSSPMKHRCKDAKSLIPFICNKNAPRALKWSLLLFLLHACNASDISKKFHIFLPSAVFTLILKPFSISFWQFVLLQSHYHLIPIHRLSFYFAHPPVLIDFIFVHWIICGSRFSQSNCYHPSNDLENSDPALLIFSHWVNRFPSREKLVLFYTRRALHLSA